MVVAAARKAATAEAPLVVAVEVRLDKARLVAVLTQLPAAHPAKSPSSVRLVVAAGWAFTVELHHLRLNTVELVGSDVLMMGKCTTPAAHQCMAPEEEVARAVLILPILDTQVELVAVLVVTQPEVEVRAGRVVLVMQAPLDHRRQRLKRVLATVAEAAHQTQAARVALVVLEASRVAVAVVVAAEQPPEVLVATVATVMSLS